ITIAIIDDGVDYLHPQLGGAPIPNSKVIMGVDLAEGHNNPRSILNTHGTACAGIAAGSRTTAGGDYTGGVAPDAKIAAVKVFGDGHETAFTSIVMAGIDWSIDHQFDSPANPIMVLNMSISGGRYTSTTDCWISNPSFFFAVDAAVASGMTVVVASGNNGFCDALGVPACLSPVISVGAVYDETFSGTVSTCLSSQS